MKVKLFNIKYNIDDKSLPTSYEVVDPINNNPQDKYFLDNLLEEIGSTLFDYKYIDKNPLIVDFEYIILD